MFKAAIIAGGLALAVVGAAWLDGHDGEVRLRNSGVIRFAEEPGRFRGALITRYGVSIMLLGVGAFTFALGGLGMQMSRKPKA
jgi:hypothetical protein